MSTPWRGLSRPGRPRLLPSPGQCPQRTCRGPGGWAGARDSRPQPSCPARSPAVGPPVPLTCPRSWCELSAPETTVVTWQPYPGNRLRAPASRQRPPRGPEVWARPEMVGRVPGTRGSLLLRVTPGLPRPPSPSWTWDLVPRVFRAAQPSMWGPPRTKQQAGLSEAVPTPRESGLTPEAPPLPSGPMGSQGCLCSGGIYLLLVGPGGDPKMCDHIQSPGPCPSELTREMGLCRCDCGEGLEMRSCWIIWGT